MARKQDGPSPARGERKPGPPSTGRGTGSPHRRQGNTPVSRPVSLALLASAGGDVQRGPSRVGAGQALRHHRPTSAIAAPLAHFPFDLAIRRCCDQRRACRCGCGGGDEGDRWMIRNNRKLCRLGNRTVAPLVVQFARVWTGPTRAARAATVRRQRKRGRSLGLRPSCVRPSTGIGGRWVWPDDDSKRWPNAPPYYRFQAGLALIAPSCCAVTTHPNETARMIREIGDGHLPLIARSVSVQQDRGLSWGGCYFRGRLGPSLVLHWRRSHSWRAAREPTPRHLPTAGSTRRRGHGRPPFHSEYTVMN